MRSFLSFLLLGLWGACVHALSSSGSRLLVVLEDDKSSYSNLWADLEARGYDLAFESPKSEKLSLFAYGEKAFDHLLILPTKSKGLGPSLSPKLLLDFLNDKGNILLALSGKTSTPSSISSLLLELDLHISPDRSSIVVDHFNYDTVSATDKHDVLLLPLPTPARSDVKPFFSGEGVLALPRPVGQSLGNTSPLLAPIVSAPETAYSYNIKDDAVSVEESFATGSQLALVSALQARNSARLTVLGSAEALEDKWFSASVKSPGAKAAVTPANREFAHKLTAWTFQEIGVLRVGKIEHYLTDEYGNAEGEVNPTIYRIKNDVTFDIELSEYEIDKWVPFKAPATDDIQLEFNMLSPWHRLNLKPKVQTENSTIYGVSFTTPDQHGIFSFRVNYNRPFLTNIEEKHEVTVRHFAHDEYPRSWKIRGGWVWIAGLWSVIGGFLAFVLVWLYSAPAPSAEAKIRKVK